MGYEPIRPAGLPPLPKISQMAMLVDVVNYSQLDLYAQIILRELPEDPHANLACAWVAKCFNLQQKFENHFSLAEQSERSIDDLAEDLHLDATELKAFKPDLQAQWFPEKPAYHLIKAWGFGFGSEMAALMGQAYLAEIMQRQPIVHWGDNFLYRDGGNVCVFHHFFKPFIDTNSNVLISVSNFAIHIAIL